MGKYDWTNVQWLGWNRQKIEGFDKVCWQGGERQSLYAEKEI